MAIYRVTYSSMTARYGPSYIEADSELEAKRQFAGTAFTWKELACISAVEVSPQEISRALHRGED